MALQRIAGSADKVLASAIPLLMKPMGMGVYNAHRLFSRINKAGNKKEWEGESLQGAVVTSTYGKAASYANDDPVNTTGVEPFTAVQWELGGYQVSVNIPGMKIRKVQTSAQKVYNLAESEIKLAMHDMMDLMSVHLFQSTNDAKGLISLDTITDASTALGGLAASSAWGGTTTASGPFASQGKADLMTLFMTLSKYQGWDLKPGDQFDGPDLHVTRSTEWQLYWASLEGSMRYTAGGKGDVLLETMFMGQPIVLDEHLISGRWYQLRTSDLSLYVMPDADFELLPETRATTQPDMFSRAAIWNGQIVSRSRRMNGKLTGLS